VSKSCTGLEEPSIPCILRLHQLGGTSALKDTKNTSPYRLDMPNSLDDAYLSNKQPSIEPKEKTKTNIRKISSRFLQTRRYRIWTILLRACQSPHKYSVCRFRNTNRKLGPSSCKHRKSAEPHIQPQDRQGIS
jgi:hypothetical protein